MDLYEAIRNRYSVRSYKSHAVEQPKLERLLEAARLAPSGRNTQEWKFIVVRDPAVREALGRASGQPHVSKAPVVIAIVSTDPQRVMFCGIPAAPVDCAIAIEHIALAAVSEGLGSCWIGHFDQDQCRRILAVPDGMEIIEILLIGYPSDPPRPKARKTLQEIVCYDRFS